MMEPEPFADETCERCQCIDLSGSEGVRPRADVIHAGVASAVYGDRPVRLCDFCYGRVTGSEPDPLAEIDQLPGVTT